MRMFEVFQIRGLDFKMLRAYKKSYAHKKCKTRVRKKESAAFYPISLLILIGNFYFIQLNIN